MMIPAANREQGELAGLDLLATAVIVVDDTDTIRHMNPAAENLFELSSQGALGQPIGEIFAGVPVIPSALAYARSHNCSYSEHDVPFEAAGRPALHLSCTVTSVELSASDSTRGESCVIEFRPINQQLRIAREERLHDQNAANRELVRNLAHEIKNPLGGIRGAAQLLGMELDGKRELTEYTQVIIDEADRLQLLVDRLLAPHRRAHIVADVNIHEVCERVRSLVLAEHPRGLHFRRDYDTSIPEFRGDREQLIQAVLNIAHNAVQALAERILAGDAELTFRTRIGRQVTIGKIRWRLALELHIEDNGPGVPEAIRDRIFFPLVTGREGGSGLGLTLAQTFVQQHQGTIECISEPGRTAFTILIPLP
jgi:two-component system nitrogen regulation sensor histidine kinase GlnL